MNYLKLARINSRYSQDQLAKKLGTRQAQYSRIERNPKRAEQRYLIKLSEILNLEISKFQEEVKPGRPLTYYNSAPEQSFTNLALSRLSEFLLSKNIDQTTVAKRIGVSQPTFSRYLKGQTEPTVSTALKIEKITGGYVSVYDWG